MKEYIKKICLCGDPGVGKTSLIRRFVTGKYDEKYISTLGTVVSKKTVDFPQRKFTLNMQIWDISGQAEFKRIHASAFKHANGALAVCSILEPDSAMNLYEWISNLHMHARERIPVVILVNKVDLVKREKRYLDKIKLILQKLDYPIMTTSAKTGYHVEDGFRKLGKTVALNFDNFPKQPLDLVAIPEIFENPLTFMDYITTHFSSSFGDEEMGMHMMRKQIATEGIDFKSVSSAEALRIIDRLVDIMESLKGVDKAKVLRTEFMEAYKRCKWT
jgi:small GTP-binding protein